MMRPCADCGNRSATLEERVEWRTPDGRRRAYVRKLADLCEPCTRKRVELLDRLHDHEKQVIFRTDVSLGAYRALGDRAFEKVELFPEGSEEHAET
jgi:hypothetical protein